CSTACGDEAHAPPARPRNARIQMSIVVVPKERTRDNLPSWKWLVCGLLLLATMLNYMDRLTINLTAVEIKEEMQLNNSQYGEVEWIFGIGFAIGALVMGWCAD